MKKTYIILIITLFLQNGITSVQAEPAFSLEAVSNDDFSVPHDIVLNKKGDLLFVADNGNDRIAVLNPKTLQPVYSFGHQELSEPHDVAFDFQDRLLVADTGNSRIAVYKIQNNKATLINELKGKIRRPEGVVAKNDGSIIATGAASGNVVIFKNGKAILEKKGLASAHDVELDRDGNIWVADTGHERIIMLDEKLNLIKEISGKSFSFNGPRYLDFHRSGLMLVADKYSHSIKIISPDSKLIYTLGTGKAGKGEGLFDRPEGVEIRGSDVWFADTYNNRIVRYKLILPNRKPEPDNQP